MSDAVRRAWRSFVASPPRRRAGPIGVLDIGTSKIVCLIAQLKPVDSLEGLRGTLPLEDRVQHQIEDPVRDQVGRYLGEVAKEGETIVVVGFSKRSWRR